MSTHNKKRNTEFEQVTTEYIKSDKAAQTKICDEEVDQVWAGIEKRILQEKSRKLRRNLILTFSAAACILLVLGGSYLYIQQKEDPQIHLEAFTPKPKAAASDEIVLLTANNEALTIEDQADLKYDKNGNIQLNSEAMAKVEDNTVGMNQIIVPKGKRVNLFFSDGTKMYVNSNTRVIFPSVFEKDKRAISVDGEVYLEVKKDENRPFWVETNEFKVRVLGTCFNVNSYSGKNESTVVLVSGKVEVETKEKSVTLSPSEMLRFKEGTMETQKVDVSEYICWIHNTMMFNKEPLNKALLRLSAYYGFEIIQEDSLGNIPLNGKIDLRDNLKEVLSIIEAAAPVTFTFQNELIYVKRKE